jgi:hypothetical protein
MAATEKPPVPKLSDKDTKQETLEAYSTVVRQLEEKRAEEVVAAAPDLTPDGVERALGNLKADIG